MTRKWESWELSRHGRGKSHRVPGTFSCPLGALLGLMGRLCGLLFPFPGLLFESWASGGPFARDTYEALRTTPSHAWATLTCNMVGCVALRKACGI